MKKAIFLDRDGVINEVLSTRVKFVNKPSDFYLIDGVGEAIKTFNLLHYKVFVVTNQGGVGLGYMKESELGDVHKKMHTDLAEYGARIDDISVCIHKPNTGCHCRKPKPGMLVKLSRKHDIDVNKSFMVGDRKQDIEAGKQMGTTTVLIGNREKENIANLVFDDLYQFSQFLMKTL